MNDITLSWFEAAMASDVGRMRQLAALKKGMRDQHGYDGLGWTEHIEGACGEMCVAKHLGVYWDGSVNTFKGDDLPGGAQVRTRSRHDYELIIRPNDDPNAAYILVTGKCPKYKIRGWIFAEDGRKDEWWKAYGGRPPAHFVPHDALRPIHELQNYIELIAR